MLHIRNHERGLAVAAVLIACFAAASPMWAQTATGRIFGTVTDPTSAVIPGVTITATNVDTQVMYQAITDEHGAYQAPLLPIGNYTVTAELAGFQKAVTKAERLEINANLRVDIKLSVGAVTQEVRVEEGISHVETLAPTLGMSVTSSQIRDMPLNGRNTLDLALLQPGVIPAVGSSGAGTFSVAGGRQDSVTFLLDGGINNNLLSNGVVVNPNPDMVEEFKILTSAYNAEYGRNAGGIVSVVTKSGTNQFHGTAYDYIRNDALNANAFFNNANGLPKEILKRNQYGGTVGGPVVKEKLFFFSSWQSQRQSRLQTTSKVTVFTPAELNGDFSLSNSTKTGPDANVAAFLQKFPFFQPNAALAAQAIIDPSKINSVSKNYIKAGLIPTDPSGAKLSQGSGKDNRDEITNKVDYNLTPRDRISTTLSWSTRSLIDPYLFANVNGYTGQTDTKRYFFATNYIKTISPTLLNDFRFTAQRNNNLQSVPSIKAPTSNELGIGITSDHATGPTILNFTSGMTAGFSPQGPTALIDNTFTWNDNVTWIKGSHAFKTGATYTPYQNNTVYDFHVNGDFFFRATTGTVYTRNDRADFILGLADEYEQFPEAPSNIRQKYFGGFFQDEWKVNRSLMLTFGVRYEHSTPKLDLQGRSFTWALGQQSTVFTKAPKGILFPGDANAPKGSNFSDKNDWAPRFGFAWSPGTSGKMSIRGGFGVFFDILKAEDNLQFNGQAPFFAFADIFYPSLTVNPTAEMQNMSKPFVAAGAVNPFPSKPPDHNINFQTDVGTLGGSGVYSVAPDLRTPYVYQYNLDIQREIMRNTILDVAYAGSSSHKLTGLYDSNPFVPGTTSRMFNVPSGNVSSAFSYLDTFANVGNGRYNSLQVGLTGRERTVSHVGGLSYQLSYTYSKSEDTVSGFRSNNSRVPFFDRKRFFAVSDFDLTNVISLSGKWDIPVPTSWGAGYSRLLKGWSVIPSFSHRSGQPLDVLSRITRNSTRTGPSAAGDPNLVRADLVAPIAYFDPHLKQTLSKGAGNYFFDPAAFSTAAFSATGFDPVNNPAQRTYGTFGRNAFRGPERNNVDLSLQKTTNISERIQTRLSADFFNVFNMAEFSNPNVNITNGTFGQISSTADPRIIQVALKILF